MAASETLNEIIGRSGIMARDVTAVRLREAMDEGKLSSAELVLFYLDRIARLNEELGAVISVSDQAAEEARAIDLALAGGAEAGPLTGIPVLVKDNISAAGMPATAGSPALQHADAEDAFLVARLRQAGAVIMGKANLSEWANFRSTRSSSGWSSLGGQALNPYGSGRNPSGSSSGSAVALAACLAPLAIGTETDGSLISPASVCGVVGIKPTLGLISRTGIVPLSLDQDTPGPMGRSVADAALLLSVMAGRDPADSVTAPADGETDYTSYLDAEALAGARIGIWRDGDGEPLPAASAIRDQVAALLRASGAEVIDPIELPGAERIAEPERIALIAEFKTDLNAYLAGLGGRHPLSLAELIEFNLKNERRVLIQFGQEIFLESQASSGRTGKDRADARADAVRLARTAIDHALVTHRLDAVLSLSGNPAWLTDHVLGDNESYSTSAPAAVAGYPSISVPAGRVSGLPVGVSFTGAPWSEPRLVALAFAFERARSAQSTVDQARADQDRADQARANQARADQARADHARGPNFHPNQ